jgi:hypothetical protein
MFRNCGYCAKNGRLLSTAPVVDEPSTGALISRRMMRSLPRDPTYDTVTELFRKSSCCIVAWKYW